MGERVGVMSSKTEYLYRLVAVREKRKLEKAFVYNQILQIERQAEEMKTTHPDNTDYADEILELCYGVRGYLDEM